MTREGRTTIVRCPICSATLREKVVGKSGVGRCSRHGRIRIVVELLEDGKD